MNMNEFWFFVFPPLLTWLVMLLTYKYSSEDEDGMAVAIFVAMIPFLNLILIIGFIADYLNTKTEVNKNNISKKEKQKKIKQTKYLKEKSKKHKIKLNTCYICEKEFEDNRKPNKFIKPICPSCVKDITGEDINIDNNSNSNYNKPKVWNSDNYYQYKTMGLG